MADVPSMWANQDEIHKLGIRLGDLLVCEGGEGGRCAIAQQPNDNCIIEKSLHRVRPHEQNLNAYLQYVLSTIAETGWFDVLNDKATIAHFTKEKFDALQIPVPPPADQISIAAFLDRETAKIDALVSRKERLIELLQEKRAALIGRAVTKGLDPDAPMKNSGVEWLGEIPTHWAVARLKSHVANIADQTDECGADEIYLALENVEGWTGKLLEVGNDASFDSRVKRFQIGDVLFGKLRPYLAKVTSPNYNGVCVSEFFVLRSRSDGFMSKYLEYLLLSRPIIDAINSATYGAKMPRADWQFMGGMKQPVPPLTEQTNIAAFLDRETTKIDALVSRKERLIELLQEKRTALISAAVTGQIDVREEAGCT